MRMRKRGQKGFTLIELLIVVAILGILAAVIIPNVSRFMGRGEEEARKTEKQNVQLAVTAMMTDLSVSALTNVSNPYTEPGGAVDDATNLMSVFPGGDAEGEVLYATNKYLSMDSTQYYYTCEADGSIRQWASVDTTDPLDEYKD